MCHGFTRLDNSASSVLNVAPVISSLLVVLHESVNGKDIDM